MTNEELIQALSKYPKDLPVGPHINGILMELELSDIRVIPNSEIREAVNAKDFISLGTFSKDFE